MDIGERLDKLERRNTHLFVGLCALTLVAIMAYASGKNSIDASEFRLLDESGITRALLTTEGDNVGFMFFDADETMRARLWVRGHESVTLDLIDATGKANVSINALSEGGLIAITDGNANLRYVCDVNREGTAMLFFDDNMEPVWTAP
jgi:hypothetical protein